MRSSILVFAAGLALTGSSTAQADCRGPIWATSKDAPRTIYRGDRIEHYRICVRPGRRGPDAVLTATLDGMPVPLTLPNGSTPSCADLAGRSISLGQTQEIITGTYCRSGLDSFREEIPRMGKARSVRRSVRAIARPNPLPFDAPACFRFGGRTYCE